MLPESVKKLREPIAALLLGAAVLYLIVSLTQLFKDDGSTFSERSFALQNAFVNPVWVLVVLVAAWVVTSDGERSPRARLIVLVALGVLALMALLAVITWLASLGADVNDQVEFLFGGGKLAKSFLFLAGLLVLVAGLLLLYSLFKSLPAPVRTPKTPQQQWGGGQPQQWSAQPQQQQWSGQPPPPASAVSWTTPGAGQQPQPTTEPPQHQSAPPAQSWGQPEPSQQSWGQPAPQPPPQPPSGQRPPQPGGATAVPVGEEQPPAPPAGGESTAVWTTPPQGGQPEAAPEARREDEDDSRPGWWNPGS